jgi:hypothetical protein
MSFLEEVEAIKRSDLDSEAKKKALRKLRRQYRKSKIQTPEQKTPKFLISEEELIQKYSENLSPGDPKADSFYYYSVKHCLQEGIELQTLIDKFQKKFNRVPHQYSIHKQGVHSYFGLGPIPKE